MSKDNGGPASDRELLEMSAKAAGYEVEWVRNSGCHYRCEAEESREQWCPLDDDGDAMRLAVKCSISLNTMLVDGMNRPRHETAACSSYGLPIVHDNHNGDPYAATRRAIVRAAAAIGSAM